MPVGEMLSRMSSYEVTEWRAYELATGPLGSQFSDDVLAAIHEQLQFANRMAGEQFEENPAPPIRSVKRPSEVFDLSEEEMEDVYTSPEAFDSQFD